MGSATRYFSMDSLGERVEVSCYRQGLNLQTRLGTGVRSNTCHISQTNATLCIESCIGTKQLRGPSR